MISFENGTGICLECDGTTKRSLRMNNDIGLFVVAKLNTARKTTMTLRFNFAICCF